LDRKIPTFAFMKRFSTLVEAIDDLTRRGFTLDFDLKSNQSGYAARQLHLHPDDFEIVEVHRFEGFTNPDDSSVLYAIVGKNGQKGVSLNAYGLYADPVLAKLLANVEIHHS